MATLLGKLSSSVARGKAYLNATASHHPNRLQPYSKAEYPQSQAENKVAQNLKFQDSGQGKVIGYSVIDMVLLLTYTCVENQGMAEELSRITGGLGCR